MADPKDAKVESAESGAAAAGGGSKIMLGLLGLNMVAMIAVAVILFLGQKRQAHIESLDQVAQGAQEAGHGAAAPAGGGEHGGGGGGGGEHGGGGAPAAPQSDVRFFNVGDFTANLSGPASTHYVKLSVNFEISKEADEEEMKQRKPQFRDKIISLLNSKKPEDLQGPEGRTFLKDEIKSVVNSFVTKGKVDGVYFSTFVIN